MITGCAHRFLLAVSALSFLAAPAASSDGQTRIAPWHGDLDAAVSLRFDDSLESHVTTVIPQLNRYGFRATFLINPGSRQYRARQDFWEQKVPSMGHRLGNHTMNHRGARSVEDADYEIGEVARTIWRVQPGGSKLQVFASGGGKKLWGGKEWEQADPPYRQLVQKYHLIDLYDGKHPSLSARSHMTIGDLCDPLDKASAKRGHQAYTFHDIGRSSFLDSVKTLISGYGMTIKEEIFAGFLKCLDERKGRLWVAPLIDILKYEEEARDAAVRLVRTDRNVAYLALSVTTDPALYDSRSRWFCRARRGGASRAYGRQEFPVRSIRAGPASFSPMCSRRTARSPLPMANYDAAEQEGHQVQAMSVLDVVKSRRSIRVYRDRPVPDDVIDDLIEALRWAPSAGNLESRKFYFVFDPERRRSLAGAAGDPHLAARMKQLVKTVVGRNPLTAAPLVIVACLDRRIGARYGERGERLYAIQDVAASLMNMMLVANDRGLGTVWIGSFDEDAAAAALDLPEHLRPVALVPVGYAAQVPAPPARAPRERVVEFIR